MAEIWRRGKIRGMKDSKGACRAIRGRRGEDEPWESFSSTEVFIAM